MNSSAFKGFIVLAVMALTLPGLVWGAAAKKDIKKTSAVEKKLEAPAAVTPEQKPATTAAPAKLDERWFRENQHMMELLKEKKFDEGIKAGQATLDYLKEAKLLEGPEAATTFNNLGSIYVVQGQFPNAMVNLTKALKIRTRVYGDTSIGWPRSGSTSRRCTKGRPSTSSSSTRKKRKISRRRQRERPRRRRRRNHRVGLCSERSNGAEAPNRNRKPPNGRPGTGSW